MTTLPRFAALGLTLLAAGCQSFDDIGREPLLSPVGSGLASNRHALPASFAFNGPHSFNSLYANRRDTLFTDPRAARVGDVLTVKISIDDRATLDNASSRERQNGSGFGLDLFSDVEGIGHKAEVGLDASGNSKSRGKGSIDRSEEIRLAIAATVVEELPGGNLLIAGAQEVRVNAELRVLQVTGIVRSRDIDRDNTITYEKIAEARISYGGRGRSSEFQQPPVVQQIYDRIAPF